MSEIDVRLVELGPASVASFWAFGTSPENEANGRLLGWAGPRGLLQDMEKHRLFGFNNPNPSAGSPNYGYEAWIVVDPGTEPEGDMKVLHFDGGLYAVTRCVVPKGQFDVIGTTWKRLVAWREDSRYKCGTHQWLEESLSLSISGPEFVLDLYLPIAE